MEKEEEKEQTEEKEEEKEQKEEKKEDKDNEEKKKEDKDKEEKKGLLEMLTPMLLTRTQTTRLFITRLRQRKVSLESEFWKKSFMRIIEIQLDWKQIFIYAKIHLIRRCLKKCPRTIICFLVTSTGEPRQSL